jgi:hypothetical protein
VDTCSDLVHLQVPDELLKITPNWAPFAPQVILHIAPL